jgi:hypothetical protein
MRRNWRLIQKGFGHGVRTALSVEDYLNYWMSNVGAIAQIVPDGASFESSFRCFVGDGLIAELDLPQLSTEAAALGAVNLNVIPGLEVVYRWPLADAAAIDKSGDGMVAEVRRKANQAIATRGGALVTDGEAKILEPEA